MQYDFTNQHKFIALARLVFALAKKML